jgi:hypothetical protein
MLERLILSQTSPMHKPSDALAAEAVDNFIL